MRISWSWLWPIGNAALCNLFSAPLPGEWLGVSLVFRRSSVQILAGSLNFSCGFSSHSPSKTPQYSVAIHTQPPTFAVCTFTLVQYSWLTYVKLVRVLFLTWRYMFTGNKTTLTTPLSQMSMCGLKNVQSAIHES